MLSLGSHALLSKQFRVLFQLTRVSRVSRVPHLPPQEAGPGCAIFDPWNPWNPEIFNGASQRISQDTGSQVHVEICWDVVLLPSFTIFYHLLPHLSSTSFNFQLQKTMCWMCFQYTAIHYLVIIRQYTASLHSCLTPWSRQPRNSWHITLNNKCQADSETPCSLKCQGDSLR